MKSFSKSIAPAIALEIESAKKARLTSDPRTEFQHLERAHVLGQASTVHHVRVHVLMLLWGLRNKQIKEALGQIFRITGAATKTAFGLVPSGNTGGTNISPFKRLPIAEDLQAKINAAVGAK
jgi:Protein of unknown function (DUF3703)